MSVVEGIMGQIQGPFRSDQNIAAMIKTKEGVTENAVFAKIGITVGEKDYMIYNRPASGNVEAKRFSFMLQLNGEDEEEFWVGNTQIYESDDGLAIVSLRFPEGAPASTLVDYMILPNYE